MNTDERDEREVQATFEALDGSLADIKEDIQKITDLSPRLRTDELNWIQHDPDEQFHAHLRSAYEAICRCGAELEAARFARQSWMRLSKTNPKRVTS